MDGLLSKHVLRRRGEGAIWWTLHHAVIAGLSLLLAACAGVEVRMPSDGIGLPQVARHVPAQALEALARAKPCCASLAGLPYRRLEREGSTTFEIGADSPAFEFDTGKSFFAAFRLPDWPRPLELRLTSRAAVPLLLQGLDSNRPIFNPALLVLDSQFGVRRTVQAPEGLALVQLGSGGGHPGIQVEGDLYIGESPQDAAYLIVLTTDELRARTVVSAGQRIGGFSPIGTIDLEVRSAPFLALPPRYRGAAMLVDSGRALSGVLFWHANTLFIDGNGLHYVEEVNGRLVERLSVPSASLVAARVHVPFGLDARLELDTAQGPDAPLVRRTLVLLPPRGSNAYQMSYVAAIAGQDVREGWYREPVAIVAATSAPVVEFRDPPAAPSDAAARIADKALAGGMVTAGVCGICQTGLCPPELLLPCAGLFAIGAAVGGVVGIGGELLAGGLRPVQQAPALPAPQVQAATPVVSSAAGNLVAQDALRACLLRRAAQGGAWVSQGRSATLEPDAAAAPFAVEAAVHRVALMPRSRPGQPIAEIPVQLIVDGGLVFRHTPPKPQEPREQQRTATWQGPSYTLADWSAPDGRVLEAALRDACDGLAASLLREAESLWRDAR